MKKTIIDIVKIMVAAMVAMGVVCVLIAHDASDGAILMTGLLVAGGVSTALGVFKEQAHKIYNRFDIRRREGGRSYGQAAIFIGTACIFMGTPQDAAELADDLQHYAQNARVVELTGEEQLEVL